MAGGFLFVGVSLGLWFMLYAVCVDFWMATVWVRLVAGFAVVWLTLLLGLYWYCVLWFVNSVVINFFSLSHVVC